MTERLLIIEDQPSQLREAKGEPLGPVNFVTADCRKPFSFLQPQLAKASPALIICDFNEYNEATWHWLRELRAAKPLVPLMVLVPFGDEALRSRAITFGACEVLCKPLPIDMVAHAVQTQLKIIRMSRQIARAERQVKGLVTFDDVIGYSAAMRNTVHHATLLAGAPHVLIYGESGTGKCLLASAMHGHMRAGSALGVFDSGEERGWMTNDRLMQAAHEHMRAGAALVLVDCEAAHKPLTVERLLQAMHDAKGGTLLVREVGLMPLELQKWLCNVPDVHVICTTSHMPENLMRDGSLLPQLWDILKGARLLVPSLNSRREDIALLAQHFLAVHTARNNKFILRYSDDALRALANGDWPGNVAQLSTLVYRCCMLCNHDNIDAGTLRLVQQLEPVNYMRQAQTLASDTPSLVDAQGKIKPLDAIEQEAIGYALRHFGGSMTKAAASLGIGRSTLYRRMTAKAKADYMARANQTTRPTILLSSTDFS